VKNMSLLCEVSIGEDEKAVEEAIVKLGVKP